MRKLFMVMAVFMAVALFNTPASAFLDSEEECTGISCNEDSQMQGQGQGQGQGQIGINEQDQGQDQGQQQGQIGIVAPEIEVSPEQGQQQGQIGINEQGQSQSGENTQGQIGINEQSGINKQGQIGINESDNSNEVDTSTTQGQDQSQSGVNKAVGQGNTTTYTDNSTYEAQDRNPVSSAAPVSAAACSSGVSAQGVNFGGAIAVTNKYCNLALVAETAAARGMGDVAEEMVNLMADMARADAEGLYGFRKFVRGLPVLGGFLSWVW